MLNPGINAFARFVVDEMPGLLGAIQPLGAPQSLSELARQQRSRNLANAMLAAASGMLMPSPNGYPLGRLQRLGAGLGAALQSYNEGAEQGRILDALGMDSQGASRGGTMAHPALGAVGPSGPQLAPATSTVSDRRSAPAPRPMTGGKPPAIGPRLRKFNGKLASRLEHPAVLPGGWELYGYEEESGNPVYAGPGAELRTYA